jgi:hypothetical protein
MHRSTGKLITMVLEDVLSTFSDPKAAPVTLRGLRRFIRPWSKGISSILSTSGISKTNWRIVGAGPVGRPKKTGRHELKD